MYNSGALQHGARMHYIVRNYALPRADTFHRPFTIYDVQYL